MPAPGVHPVLDALMVVASTAGLVGLAVVTPWWLWRKDPRLGRALVYALVAGLVCSLILQWLIARPRPGLADPLLPLPPLPSFPSGHAALVAATVAVVAGWRWRLGVALLPIALLVGASRVYLGHHYPSDVLGGFVLGIGLAVGAVARARAAPGDPWRLRWMLWPQIALVVTVSLAAYCGIFTAAPPMWLRVRGIDKALHLVLFGMLAFGTHLALYGRTVGVWRWRVPLAVGLPLLGACADEFAQGLSEHRTADPLDLLADLVGLLMFAWLGRRIAPVQD